VSENCRATGCTQAERTGLSKKDLYLFTIVNEISATKYCCLSAAFRRMNALSNQDH